MNTCLSEQAEWFGSRCVRLPEIEFGGGGLQQSEQFHGCRAGDGRWVHADHTRGVCFQAFQVADAHPQQPLALTGLDGLIVKGVEQVQHDERHRAGGGALQQGKHLVAGEGTRDRDALEGPGLAAGGACHGVGIEAVAAIQDAHGGALSQAGDRLQHGGVQAARANQQDPAAGLRGKNFGYK